MESFYRNNCREMCEYPDIFLSQARTIHALPETYLGIHLIQSQYLQNIYYFVIVRINIHITNDFKKNIKVSLLDVHIHLWIWMQSFFYMALQRFTWFVCTLRNTMSKNDGCIYSRIIQKKIKTYSH